VTLAERWNGTAWAIERTPNPAGSTASALNGVSCTSATACTAVGDYYTSTNPLPLVERWNGTAWAVQPVPSPSGAKGGDLFGVSCPSASACTAVGFTNINSLGVTATLAQRWNGTAWATQPTPSLGAAYSGSRLEGVSCPSATWCTATGTYGNGSGKHHLGLGVHRGRQQHYRHAIAGRALERHRLGRPVGPRSGRLPGGRVVPVGHRVHSRRDPRLQQHYR